MSVESFAKTLIPEIEEALHQALSWTSQPGLEQFYHMMAYHLGWEGDGAGPEAAGKRIRPLILLLSTAAAGGDWRAALPAAAAVELLHNFSLIHDDIEDNSPLRRGRPTVWNKWGVPQAINAGDAMFTLAHLSMTNLQHASSPATTLRALRIFQETCLNLTQGQFLDMSYEARGDLTVEAYWPMVSGKTAALLAACTEIGACVACATDSVIAAYRRFGHSLGLAFQAQDDLLGIWGDAEVTGKSSDSDLVSGKKSLPVLYGLGLDGPFARRWKQGLITEQEVPEIAAQLACEGARDYTQQQATSMTEQALQALDEAQPKGEAGEALRSLAHRLLHRAS